MMKLTFPAESPRERRRRLRRSVDPSPRPVFVLDVEAATAELTSRAS